MRKMTDGSYAHPSEADVAYADGRWHVDTVDAVWRDRPSRHAQPSGIALPADPV